MKLRFFVRTFSLIAIFGLSLDAWSQEYDIGPPTNVDVLLYDKGLVPTWEPPTNAPEGAIFGYEVMVDGGEPLPTTTLLRYVVPDLEPSTTYQLSVYGVERDPNDFFNYLQVTEAATVSATTLAPGEGIETFRISTGTTTANTNVRGQHPDISKDGRWIVYEKQVQEAGLDFQIELVDWQQGTSQIISRNASGEFADRDCTYPVISNDGRYVAFISEAQNLTLDTIPSVRENVFLYDTQTQEMTLVSAAPAGGGTDTDCANLSISGDGSTVAFTSRATNLTVPNLESPTGSGYLYSVVSSELTILPNDETNSSTYTDPDKSGETVDIAVNGDASLILKSVRFPGYEQFNYRPETVLFLYNPATDESINITPSTGNPSNIAITDDGRFVSFLWEASSNSNRGQIIPGTQYNIRGFYLHDVIENRKEMLGITVSGGITIQGDIFASALSDDGRFAVYSVFNENFGISDTNGEYDIYMNDRVTGKVTRISRASDGTEANGDSGVDTTNSEIGPIGISGDGSRVVYNSRASNLVPDDTNSREDVFLTEVTIESADMNEPVWPDGSSLTADEIGATLVTLSWTAAVDGEGNLTAYRVYQDDVQVGTTTDDQRSFSVTGLQPETAYQFRVEALDIASNESTAGPALQVTTESLSSGGASLAAPAVSGGIIQLTWDPAANEIANYVVQRQATGSENWETLAEPAAGVTSYEDTSLPSGATFSYRVLIQPLAGGEPVAHTQTVEAAAPELFIDKVSAQLPRAERSLFTLAQGGSVGLALQGEPNRNAQALIAYQAWSRDDPTAEASPVTQEAIVPLAESASTAGLYQGDWTLPVRTASIDSVSLQLDDGFDNQVSQSAVGLPRNVEARFSFNLLAPGGFGILNEIKVSLSSQSAVAGRSHVYENAGQFSGVGLPDAADFELKIFEDNKLTSETAGIRLRAGLLTSLERTVLPPPQLETLVTDFNGQPRAGIQVNVTDKNSFRPVASALTDQEGRAVLGEGQNLFTRGMELTYTFGKLPWDLGRASGDIIIPQDDTPIEIQVPRSGLLFDPGTLTVQVTDSSGQPIEGATVFSESLETGINESASGTTDSSGSFVYDNAIGRNAIVVRPPYNSLLGRGSTEITVPDNGSVSATVELQTLYRQEIRIPSIQLTDATGATQTFSTTDRRRLARQIQIRVVQDGELFAAVIENGDNGVLQAKADLPNGAGYTVTIDANRIGYGSESIQATVDGNGEIVIDPLELEMTAGNYLTAVLTGEGDGLITDETAWTASLAAVGKDDEGEEIFGLGPRFVFPNADVGPHRLTIRRLDSSRAAREIEVVIASGANDLGEIDVSPTGLLARSRQTTFSSLPNTVSAGGLIRANLTLSNSRGSQLADVLAAVTLPRGVNFLDGSLVVDDVPLEPSIVDGDLVIPYGSIDEYSQEIAVFQLQVSPDFVGSSFELAANVSYQGSRDTTTSELVAIARHDVIRGPTISGPQQVGQRTVEVSGRAPAGKVVILDGGIPVGQANVSEAGFWKKQILLTDPKTPYWHSLTAQWYSLDLTENEVSSPLVLLRNPNVSRPVRVRFRQPTDEADSPEERRLVTRFPDVGDWTEFEVPEGGPARFWRRILAGFPFEFEVEFNQPDDVEDVVMEVEGPAGGTALATKGEDGIYRARIEASRDAEWNAGPIKVSWAPRAGQEFPRWANELEFGEIEILEPEEEEVIQVSSVESNAGTNGVADHRFSPSFEHPNYEGDLTVSLSSGRSLPSPDPSVSYSGGSISYSSARAPMFNASYSYSYSANRISASIIGYIPLERFADRDRAAPAFGENATLVAMSATDSQVELGWSPALDDNWVDSYTIYQGETMVASVEGDALSVSVDNLVPGQSYDFSLRANDPTGKSSAPVNLTLDFQGSSTETSPVPSDSTTINVPGLGLVDLTQNVSASGGKVKIATNLTSNLLGPALDVFSLLKDIYDQEELVDRWEDMKDSLEACDGVPPSQRSLLDQEIREAAEAVIAKNALAATMTGASVAFAVTGVGAPFSAALAVSSLAVGYIAGDVADRELQGVENAYQAILEAYPDCEEDEDEDPKRRKRRSESTVADPTWKIDPSGFVYEVVEENRLQGLTATIFTGPTENGPWRPWDAENYGEINPQITGSGGNYRWDVPAGFWLVEYKKDGYETAFSDVLPVPPPHFDVNIPVKSLAPPQVELVRSLQSGANVELSFASYVDISTISVGTIRIRDSVGDYVAGTIAPIADSLADNPHDEVDALNVAHRFLFTPDETLTQGASYAMEIEGVVESYGGVPIGDLLEIAFDVADNYEGVYFGSFAPSGGSWVARVGEAGDIELRGHDGAAGGSYVGSGLVDESGSFSVETPSFGDGAVFDGQIEQGSIDGAVSVASYTASGSRVPGTSGDLVPAGELLGAVSLSADTLVDLIYADTEALLVVNGGLANGTVQLSLDDAGQASGALSDGSQVSVDLSSDGGRFTGSLQPAGTEDVYQLLGTTQSVGGGARLVNVSGRGVVGSSENSMIAGYVLWGPDASETNEMVVRAVGPTLASQLAVDGALVDPKLSLFKSTGPSTAAELLLENDQWQTGGTLQEIDAAFAGLGAFLLDEGSEDAAVIEGFQRGLYTAVAQSDTGDPGIALVEVYDSSLLGGPESQLSVVNLSIRGRVGTGDEILIAGFVVDGTAPVRVLIRGVGPALGAQEVGDPLADPELSLFRQSDLALVNDDWGDYLPDATAMSGLFADVGAFAFDEQSLDSAMVVWLAPGLYTTHLRGASGQEGIGLIELYVVENPF